MYTNLSFSFKDIFKPKKNLTPVSKKKTTSFASKVKTAIPKGKALFGKVTGLIKKFKGGGEEEAAAPAAEPQYAPEAAAPAGGGLPKWALPAGIGVAALLILPKILGKKR